MAVDPWPFTDPRNVAVLTTTQVIRDGQAVLYVTHDLDDGAWQFHTGNDHVSVKDAMVVGLEEMVEHDPTLIELHDLPLGWIAMRDSRGSGWARAVRSD